MTSLAVAYPSRPSFGSTNPGIRILVSAGWLVAAVSVLLGIAVWLGDGLPSPAISFGAGPANVVAVGLIALTTATVGAVLAWRHPRNPIGWLLLAEGISTGFITPVNLLVGGASALVHPWPVATLAAAWAVSTLQVPVTGTTVVFVFLLFPDGRFAGRRWWIAGLTTAIGAGLLALASALDPSGLVWYPILPNPTAVDYSRVGTVDAIRTAGVAVTLTALLLAAASVAVRYRGADGRERLQLRWIVAGAAIMLATFIPFIVGRYLISVDEATGNVVLALMAIGASAFPVTIAIAVVREHLYEIDELIWHTLVYVPLMGLMGGLYAASLALFQRLFVSLTGNSSDAAIVLSSLVLASVFTPARAAIEAQVTHRFKPASPVVAAEMHHRALGEPIPMPSPVSLVAAAPPTRSPGREEPRQVSAPAPALRDRERAMGRELADERERLEGLATRLAELERALDNGPAAEASGVGRRIDEMSPARVASEERPDPRRSRSRARRPAATFGISGRCGPPESVGPRTASA